MKIGESICDYCYHDGVCEFREIVPSDLAGHDMCRHPQGNMFLGWVKTKDELPPNCEDVVMMDKNDIPFVGWYFKNEKKFTDESTERSVEIPEYWLKGLDLFAQKE